MTRTRIQAKTRFKKMPCRVCQKPMQVGSSTRNAPRCLECGLRAAMENQMQISRGAGPAFERWLAGCMARAANQGRGRENPGKQAGQNIKT